MDIVTDVEKLSARADEIDVRKHGQGYKSTIYNLKSTIRYNNLLSLSAPQIGEMYRAFVIKFGTELRSFCNPIITNCESITLSRETCSSIPGKEFLVPRYNIIDVAYQTPYGAPKTSRLVGIAAFKFQHCLDHLEGILISDIGLEIDEDFDNASEEERIEVINMFLDAQDMKLSQLNKEIEQDSDLKELNDAIKFMEGVQSGTVKVEHFDVNNKEGNLQKDE